MVACPESNHKPPSPLVGENIYINEGEEFLWFSAIIIILLEQIPLSLACRLVRLRVVARVSCEGKVNGKADIFFQQQPSYLYSNVR